jgi:hypothetical protein
MNEVEAYQAVYGDLVNCIPHYKERIKEEKRREHEDN